MDNEWRRDGGLVEAEMLCNGDLLSAAEDGVKIWGKKIQICFVTKNKKNHGPRIWTVGSDVGEVLTKIKFGSGFNRVIKYTM